MKSTARAIIATTLNAAGALALHRRVVLRKRAIILLYHRVLRPDEVTLDLDPAIYVTTETFESHLQALKRTFDMVDLDALLAWQNGNRSSTRTPCAITFDDGWSDNFTNAFPLLKRYGIPATIFLITGSVGEPGFMTWDQVRQMESDGIRFGSHTVRHPIVEGLPEEQLEYELCESRRELERRLARPSCWFCYPKGYNDEAARHAVSRYYRAAVTTRCAPMRRSDDRFVVPRISVHQDVARTPAMLALRVSGWFTRTPTG